MDGKKDNLYLNKLISVWLTKRGYTLQDLRDMGPSDLTAMGIPEVMRKQMFELAHNLETFTVDDANDAITELTAESKAAADKEADVKYDPKVEIKEIVDDYKEPVEEPVELPVVEEKVEVVSYSEAELLEIIEKAPATVKTASALLKRLMAEVEHKDAVDADLAAKLTKQVANTRKAK